MSFKVVEDAVSDILARELKKRRVKTLSPAEIRIPKGPKFPDIAHKEYWRYIIEAEFKEEDLSKAVMKIHDSYPKFKLVKAVYRKKRQLPGRERA